MVARQTNATLINIGLSFMFLKSLPLVIGLAGELSKSLFFPTTSPPLTTTTVPFDFSKCASQSIGDNSSGIPDINATVPDIIRGHGYPLEIHNITTEDGYILTVFRIYNGYGNFTKDSSKVAVMIQHGFLGSSYDWVLNPVEKSLGFKLADAGFDVWISNARGTNNSLGHVNLSSNNISYWNFSVHEMGKFDLPAVIDHILEENKQKDLYYIGHSMGCVMFFIMTSERPEYNNKIRTMIALAPTVFRSTSDSLINPIIDPIVYGSQVFGLNLPIYEQIGRGRMIPRSIQKYLPLIFGIGCSEVVIKCALCQNALFFMYGFDPYQMNYTQLPTIVAHEPDSVSSKTFIHLSQMEWSEKFRQFDYTPYPGNQAIYGPGVTQPPPYDLSKATVPVVIFKGLGDTRANPENVDKLAAALPNLKENITVAFPQFNHIDFLFAKDVNVYVYDYVQLIMASNKYYVPQQ